MTAGISSMLTVKEIISNYSIMSKGAFIPATVTGK
jgi:hypothetical protein